MPYIKPEDRTRLDAMLHPLIIELESVPFNEQDGAVNYVVTRILHRVYGRPVKYATLNRALGVLEAIKLELYRRVVAPYEDEKIRQNGDVA